MATLLVRNVDEELVQSLRERAAANGRSAEAEHREILAKALRAAAQDVRAGVDEYPERRNRCRFCARG
jgi:plasmid stability protein